LIEPETANTETAERRESQTSLKQLALLFFKLGVISFGGPAAHIAMMEDEVVWRRRWLSRDEFLDLLGATNLIPGPNSTEMAIHIGRRRAGWPGLLVAGSCFILPATLIVTALAWAYVRYGSFPQTDALLYGVKPVVIAIILQALWGLGRAALKIKTLALVGAVGILLNFLGVHELVIGGHVGHGGDYGYWPFPVTPRDPRGSICPNVCCFDLDVMVNQAESRRPRVRVL
jgi:chromate transporter